MSERLSEADRQAIMACGVEVIGAPNTDDFAMVTTGTLAMLAQGFLRHRESIAEQEKASLRPETGDRVVVAYDDLATVATALIAAASAYRTYARRHGSLRPKAETDALFTTRADDFDRAAEKAREMFRGAAISREPELMARIDAQQDAAVTLMPALRYLSETVDNAALTDSISAFAAAFPPTTTKDVKP